jgi:CheY-like chemotaxis protein
MLRILLVEDHDVTRRAMAKILGALGYEIRCAANAQQALEAAAAHPVDLVISDLGLPDRSGYDLMEELRRLHNLRGIALSGFGMEQDRNRSQQSGFAVHMTKPVTIQALQRAIDRLANAGADGVNGG